MATVLLVLVLGNGHGLAQSKKLETKPETNKTFEARGICRTGAEMSLRMTPHLLYEKKKTTGELVITKIGHPSGFCSYK